MSGSSFRKVSGQKKRRRRKARARAGHDADAMGALCGNPEGAGFNPAPAFKESAQAGNKEDPSGIRTPLSLTTAPLRRRKSLCLVTLNASGSHSFLKRLKNKKVCKSIFTCFWFG
jgi:hypothetical protein